jgi:histidinol-phosphate aminotransferase
MLFPRDKVEAFCEVARGVVVVDEAYVDFAAEDCVDIALGSGNALVSRTLSKSFSLAGLRLGYAVGPAELIEALHKIKDSYNVDAVTQAVALAAVDDVETMRANVERVVATRRRLTARLEQLGYEVFPSDANFLWVRPAGIGAGELYERLRDDNIFVRYFPGDTTGEYVRITVGTDEQVDVLLSWLERA